jgi:antitoxin (DNA-binding transcriptional repressor) of toxin-antitoxin stability system
MTPICMIDVAQHFARYVDLVVERGERFTLLREGKPVAELGPVLQVVRLEDLPALLASLPCLTPANTSVFDCDTAVEGREGECVDDMGPAISRSAS